MTAAIALGAIPGTGGVISACYDKQSGQARIYDAEGTKPKGCGKYETSISWNQVGPSGPQGPQGQQGPSGPTGPQGPQGDKGDQGDDGQQGLKGDSGPSGPAGADGVSGWERVVQANVIVQPGEIEESEATCSSGKRVLGGGFFSDVRVFRAAPAPDGFVFVVVVQNNGDTTGNFFPIAICADVS